jgi:hypothetical protein
MNVNGFLVVVRCDARDIPLSFHLTNEEGLAAAVKVAHDPSLVEAAKLGWNHGAGPIDHFSIVEFANGRYVREGHIVELGGEVNPHSNGHIYLEAGAEVRVVP